MKRALVALFMIFFLTGSVIPLHAAEPVRDWTWMVFINADNNLDEYGVLDQEEMSKVGSSDWMNIITLIDRYDGPASYNLIEKNKVTLLRDCGELDMGDWKQLVSFVKETVERFPARRYSLVIWNHGSGWKKKGPNAVKGISYDDHSNNHITTAQLAEAMGEIKGLLGRNLDLLCMDACLMQMMEVAWPLRHSCDFILASEETVPGDGFPYHTMFGGLTPGMAIPEMGKVMTKAFYDCYKYDAGGYGGDDLVARRRDVRKTTLSMLDCSRIEPLKEALDELARTLVAGSFASPLRSALTKVQSFSYSTNIDLTHLIELLQAEIKDPGFRQIATKAREALKAMIVASQCTGYNPATGEDEPEPDLRRSPWPMPIDANGLAIYFPAQKWQFAGEYLDLAFARETLWDELIFDFYAKTKAMEILSDLEKGSRDTLRAFVREAVGASSDSPPTLALLERQALIEGLNFRLFCEIGLGRLSAPENAEVLGLLSRLQGLQKP